MKLVNGERSKEGCDVRWWSWLVRFRWETCQHGLACLQIRHHWAWWAEKEFGYMRTGNDVHNHMCGNRSDHSGGYLTESPCALAGFCINVRLTKQAGLRQIIVPINLTARERCMQEEANFDTDDGRMVRWRVYLHTVCDLWELLFHVSP